ncbi:hypothetical protein [Actinokineospora enzanensis]|uniref:hypothetical protein n=1 Tax=Actinokineospora enzanensis TaxID=155975 RepID=UPI000382AC88|nr:hypothetical protein [Actinokineospora enzanensis]
MLSLLKRTAVVITTTAAAITLNTAPAHAFGTRYIYQSFPLSACEDGGTNGTANGVFSAYRCDLGFGGYTLYALPGWAPFNDAYIHTFSMFDAIGDPMSACVQAGWNGLPTAGEATFWTSARCDNGIGGWSLRVSG